MSLWKLNEIVVATNGVASSMCADEIVGISIDTRDIAPAELFVAIKGDQFDGHDFVSQAIGKGAGAALVSKSWAQKVSSELPLIVVDDPLKGLERLAVAARARTKAKIIAITGSVGKTSTKEAVRIGLERMGRTHASIKSFNNHWGVPLMLARMPADTEFGVFEVGMNHADEIRPLVKMIKPHIAVVTNVGAVHLEHFDSVLGIAAAKAEIFEGLERGGSILLGADHDYLDALTAHASALEISNIFTFGFASNADARLQDIERSATGVCGTLEVDKTALEICVPQFGAHALVNAAAVISVGKALDLDLRELAKAMADFAAPPGRGQIMELKLSDGAAMLLDESFNANPVSMRAALSIVQGLGKEQRKIGVLGDMLELGETAPQLHAELAAVVLAAGFEKVILVGPLMTNLSETLEGKLDVIHRFNSNDVADLLAEELAPGDLVMVKGSKGTKLSPVVEQLCQRYC